MIQYRVGWIGGGNLLCVWCRGMWVWRRGGCCGFPCFSRVDVNEEGGTFKEGGDVIPEVVVCVIKDGI